MYRAGYDTVRLAASVYVSKQFISLLLTESRGCSPAIAATIAQALGWPLRALFTPFLSEKTANKTEDEMLTAVTTATDDPYLLFDEVADLARMPIGTLRHLRQTGKGPEFRKVGRRLLCKESVARAWIESHPTSA
jgi:hypothetical protein